MTVGSLFTGYGGIDLGLEACGLGPVLWQAESDPYARGVLARHWPDVPCYDDVRRIDASAARVDVVCGGFPCQDLSLAGAGGGLSAPRSGLWWEFRRIVRVLRPKYVFVENVHGGWRRWLPIVRRSLWKIGYASVPLRVSASEVGAPHRRARCFLLAYSNGQFERLSEGRSGRENGAGQAVTRNDGAQGTVADANVFPWDPRRTDHVGESQRRREPDRSDVDAGPPWIARYANVARELQPGGGVGEQWRWTRHADGWAFESPVPGVDDGTPRRLDRERLCGNGAIPQQVAIAWRTLTAIVARSSRP